MAMVTTKVNIFCIVNFVKNIQVCFVYIYVCMYMYAYGYIYACICMDIYICVHLYHL